MAGLTPEQEASYALDWNLPRSGLRPAVQLEYDRLKAEREREAALPRTAARPVSYGPPVNGDEVLNTRFLTRGGYDASEVDALLRRVAAELDAGRPAGPLIENATLRARPGERGYDVDAVDWFLNQLLVGPEDAELPGISADPWRDLAVTQFTRSEDSSDPAKQVKYWQKDLFAEECANAWRDFGQLPGTYLRWGWAERVLFLPVRHELRTAEQQAIASREEEFTGTTFRAGGRSFTYRKTSVPFRSAPNAWSPGVAELADRSWRDSTGHFAAKPMSSRTHRNLARQVHELVDETGAPILYTSGINFAGSAGACVTFPDRRWLRFLVRGTKRADAIMTAVDQAGNRVARYRKTSGNIPRKWGSVEIAVHPHQKLTDELVLAIAISAGWLNSYFDIPSGGG
jgi:DivIVA domain-containing protein